MCGREISERTEKGEAVSQRTVTAPLEAQCESFITLISTDSTKWSEFELLVFNTSMTANTYIKAAEKVLNIVRKKKRPFRKEVKLVHLSPQSNL